MSSLENSSTSDCDSLDVGEEEGTKLVRWLLRRTSRRQAFLAPLELKRKDYDLLRTRVRLWLRIHEYKKASRHLAKAHFLWQEYFADDRYEFAGLPAELIDSVKAILWNDSDGSDPLGLVQRKTFDPVRVWVEEALLEPATEFKTTPAYLQLINSAEVRPTRKRALSRSASSPAEIVRFQSQSLFGLTRARSGSGPAKIASPESKGLPV